MAMSLEFVDPGRHESDRGDEQPHPSDNRFDRATRVVVACLMAVSDDEQR